MICGSGRGIADVLADQEFLTALRLDERKQLIGSMCSGALLLAEKGLLKGRQATTYPTQFERLAKYEGVQPVQKAFVSSGNVATAGGCLAAQYLCGWLIERLLGEDVRKAALASIMPVGEGCKALPRPAAAPVAVA